MYGQTFPVDFEAMRKDWRKATPSQKVARVGIVGGFIGLLVHALASAPRSGPRPAWCTMAPEPVERDPAVLARQPPAGRGRYR